MTTSNGFTTSFPTGRRSTSTDRRLLSETIATIWEAEIVGEPGADGPIALRGSSISTLNRQQIERRGCQIDLEQIVDAEGRERG